MPTSFAWSPRSEQAAELLAKRLSIRKVAERVECNEKTIDRWKQHSEFRERISARQGELLTKMRGECLTIRREGLAIREHRILALRRRHREIMKLLRKRAGNPALGGVIGDPSGLFIGRERKVRLGKKVHKKTLDIEVDTRLLKELDKLEKAIAIETGQWKTDPNWPSEVEYSERAFPLADPFSPAELDRAMARAEALAAASEAETTPGLKTEGTTD